MSDSDPVEADRVEGAQHPRKTTKLYGQERAETTLAAALREKRMPHAWLLHGPRGVGKATLAYRLARSLLSDQGPPAGTLEIDPTDPAAKRVAANSETRLRVVRRKVNPKTGRLTASISVDDVRALGEFFHIASVAGGWHIAVVDAAEEMNPAAANALLKILEEPPKRSLLLLVSHAPHQLLPTIRSRCCHLPLRPLDDSSLKMALEMAAPKLAKQDFDTLVRTAGGSAGEALRLHAIGGANAIRSMETLLDGLPTLRRDQLMDVADDLAARNAAERREAAIAAAERRLTRLALCAAGAAVDGESLGPLADKPAQAAVWAEAVARLQSTVARSNAVNLDPAATIIAALTEIEEAARLAEAA